MMLMMLRELCNKVRMHILVDTGSTHNFIHEYLVHKLKLPVQEVSGIWVEVANGQELKCDSVCKNF